MSAPHLTPAAPPDDPAPEPPAAPLRLAPPAQRVRVSVDNNHCQRYGICQHEAPAVFDLGVDGRLRYHAHPDPAQTPSVQQAVRCCPMQAIAVDPR